MPRFLLFLVACCALAVMAAHPRHGSHVPDTLPTSWSVLGRVESSHPIHFRVLLKQRNLDVLQDLLEKVSTPGSPLYGRYMSREDILAIVAAPTDIRDEVRQFLALRGIDTTADHGDFFTVSGAAGDVEKVFSTQLYSIHDKKFDEVHVKAISGYAVPAEMAEHIHMVTGISELTEKRRYGRRLRSVQVDPSTAMLIPQTFYNLYNYGGAQITSANVTQCVVEYAADGFSAADMKTFTTGVGIADQLNVQVEGLSSSPDGEGTLDIQYIAASARNGTNVYWSLNGWLTDFAQDLFNEADPPLVNSQSWGSDERDEGADYNNRVDTEYQKLGLRGVTMLAASGDSGAGGTGSCKNKYMFNPGYPAASNYALSVGATQLLTVDGTAAAPICKSKYTCALNGTETPVNQPDGNVGDGFATGGGFSVYNPVPSYQKDVVAAYLNDASIPKPPSHGFNASNRGFPDVAANGFNLLIYESDSGGWSPIGGTSAACPVIAGIISLMNNFLITRGKAPVGFVNPLIYQMAADDPSTFLSIGNLQTNNNDGCEYGFVSNPSGWDPVTGLGTPNVQNIFAYLESKLDMFAPYVPH